MNKLQIDPSYSSTVKYLMEDHEGERITNKAIIDAAKYEGLDPERLKEQILLTGIQEGWLADEYFE